MGTELTIIKHNRIPASLKVSVPPIESPDEIMVFDEFGERYFVRPASLDRAVLETLAEQFRISLLRSAGYPL